MKKFPETGVVRTVTMHYRADCILVEEAVPSEHGQDDRVTLVFGPDDEDISHYWYRVMTAGGGYQTH